MSLDDWIQLFETERKDGNSKWPCTLLYCILCIESRVGIELSIDSGLVRILWRRGGGVESRYWTRNILVEITQRIFRAGSVFHANYSCYSCPACAEHCVRALFAKTFQRDSSVSSSRSLSSNFPGSFVPPLLAPPLCPRLFLLLFFLFLFFFFCVERHVSHSWDTLRAIFYAILSLLLFSLRYFFFLYSYNTLKKLCRMSTDFFFILIWG